jgi:hypothetical protein
MGRFRAEKIDSGFENELLEFYNIPAKTGAMIRIHLDRSPDFLNSIKTEGRNRVIYAVFDDETNKIVAAMIFNEKECFFHGDKIQVGYTSGLKVCAEYRNSMVSALLFKKFKESYMDYSPRAWYFSVLAYNKEGLKFFRKRNNIKPEFERLINLNTFIFKKRFLPVKATYGLISIRFATKNDAELILKYMADEGKRRTFLPDYTYDEIFEGKGLLHQFNYEKLAIAERNGQIAGLMALWDQSEFRRWKVIDYAKPVKLFRKLINVFLRFSGMPFLPSINENISYNLLSLILIRNNENEIFVRLFNFLMKSQTTNNKLYSIVLTENSSFNRYFRNRSIVFKSIFFKAFFPEDTKLKDNLSNLYIEQGGL